MKGKIFFLLVFLAILALAGIYSDGLFQLWGNRDRANKVISYQGQNISLTIHEINEPTYKGKVMVVKTKVPGKIKIALSEGGLGTTETTSSMARRTGAVAAVNGGGFYINPVYGKPHNYPLYVTLHEGKIIHYDVPIRPLIAVGVDDKGKLVYSNKGPEEMLKRGVQEAVSFKPALLIAGRPMIRAESNEVAPRTALGQARNGDYIFVVIDGRQKNWSEGVSLYQLMKIMQHYGAYNAFNLDGGGSSTMVFQGRVINQPSDIIGERPVATSWVIYD